MRLQAVNDSHLREHHYLDSSDDCFFFGELSPGLDNWTPTKKLVYNLKKKPNETGYQYKAGAIRQTALLLLNAIKPSSFGEITLIPIPPSKVEGDPEYDDRMWLVLEELKRNLQPDLDIDIRKLVYQTESYQASHKSSTRVSAEHLDSIYQINDSGLLPAPNRIVIIDDVLTSGCHFKAMKKILLTTFPNAKIQGIFVARRKLDSDFD
jgi:predicted amidophosphoribosyltransferase